VGDIKSVDKGKERTRTRTAREKGKGKAREEKGWSAGERRDKKETRERGCVWQ